MHRTQGPWLDRVGAALLGLRLVLGDDVLPGEPWTTSAFSLVLAAGHLARAQEARSC